MTPFIGSSAHINGAGLLYNVGIFGDLLAMDAAVAAMEADGVSGKRGAELALSA